MEKVKSYLKGKVVQASSEPEERERKEITDRVSLLELLMHSTSHRKLLMKILSGAHVERDLSLDKFEGIVSHVNGFSASVLSPQVI